jgi:hypothetical protein
MRDELAAEVTFELRDSNLAVCNVIGQGDQRKLIAPYSWTEE